MKTLLLKSIALRRRLNAANKSYIQSVQFMKNLEYWIANGVDVNQIALTHEKKIRLMLTANFIPKFNELLNTYRSLSGTVLVQSRTI